MRQKIITKKERKKNKTKYARRVVFKLGGYVRCTAVACSDLHDTGNSV